MVKRKVPDSELTPEELRRREAQRAQQQAAVAARERGESAIGYRNGKTGEVLVNPHKSHRLTASEADGLIVIGLLA